MKSGRRVLFDEETHDSVVLPDYRDEVDRRLIGALLVVGVIALAIVVPARGGVRIAGAPAAMQLPADPRVGDCLMVPPPPGAAAQRGQPSPAQSAGGQLLATDAGGFGPCTGQPAIGEVVAIVQAAGDQHGRRLRAESSGLDCRRAALAYAGLTAVDGRFEPPHHPESDPVNWKFSINLRATWVLPSALLQAAGRTWAACVAGPVGSNFYSGVLAGAYSGGRLPDVFGACWNSREVSVAIQKVDCRDPHLAELIALGNAERGSLTPTEFSNSCQRLAAEVLRRADPTASGGLTVLIDPDAADSLRWTPGPTSVVCYIVPNGQSLNGSLVGLGDRPVPYSG